MSAMPSRYPSPAGGNPTPEQAALLRERYDGQVKTFRSLGDETDVHWTTWRRWALELGLKNPPDMQPVKERKTRKRDTFATVPTEEELEFDKAHLGEDVAADVVEAEARETEQEEEQLIEEAEETPPAPTPTPIRESARRPELEPRGTGRLPFDDKRFLGQFMERLPYSWTHEERGRWLRAFVAALDLVVEQWPPAGSQEMTP